MRVPLRLYLRRLRSRRIPAFLPVLLAALILTGLVWGSLDAQLRPAVKVLAVSSATNRVTEVIGGAVADCVSRQGLRYQDFVTVETDSTGRVTSLSSDLAAAGALRREIAADIVQALDGLRQESFGVPIGTLTGWVFFSGAGPEIRVELLSAGDVTCELHHDVREAGINQTVHRVMLQVSVTVYLLIPGETISATVDSDVCVAETVIVGQVPDTYLSIERSGDTVG